MMRTAVLAATAATAVALAAGPVLAQQKTVKIGFVSTFSGPVAAIGNDMKNSFELGLDHLGRKLGGLAVEVIYEDDQLKPEVGLQKTQKLIESEQAMRAKLEAFRTKKEVIKAQYSAAEAQVRISEAATGVGEQMADVGLAMQRAVDKTENMKARADAVSELEAAGTFDDITQLGGGEDDIDRQLKQLSSQPAVDDELAKMKGELGQGAPAPQLAASAADTGEAPAADGGGEPAQPSESAGQA